MNKSQQRQIEHNTKVIDTVVQLLSKNYDTILTHVPYWINGSDDVHGEIDILAIRGRNVHYYEVKGRHSGAGLRKAVYQTNEFGRNLHNTTNLNSLIPKDAVYRKIYVSFDKQNNYVVKRLR